MDPVTVFGEGTGGDTDTAVVPVLGPKVVTRFHVDIPFQDAGIIRDRGSIPGWVFVIADGLGGARLSTQRACTTEFEGTKVDGSIGDKGEVGEDFADPDI